MNIIITPKQLQGSVVLPASKSAMHRAIIAASLADGTSIISNASFNDDTTATLNAFISWGIKYKFENKTLEITGCSSPKNNNITIDCKASGSTLRLLIPLFSKVNNVIYIGDEYLFSRPLKVYEDLYLQNNLIFNLKNSSLETSGQIKPGIIDISNAISSQFISGLLFYLPLLDMDSKIILKNIASKPYVDLTVDYLQKANINIKWEDDEIIIPKQQRYSAFIGNVEGDLSQLGYFLTLGVLGGPIEIKNINFNSSQGDRKIIEIFIAMGARIDFFEDSLIIYKSDLKPFSTSLYDTPDLGLNLFALASIIEGKSTISNVRGLIFKECNRLEVGLMISKALGADYKYDPLEDKVEIYGTKNVKNIIEFDSFNDHRVIFTLASISPILKSEIKITNASHISKSYPTFWDDFKSLGGQIR